MILTAFSSSERPRERCLEAGAHALSLRELIAVLLGSGPRGLGALGLAARIIERMGMDPTAPAAEQERAFFTALEGSSHAALAEIPGLGEAGRTRLMSSFEIARRYTAYRKPRRQRRVPSPALAARALALIDSRHRCEAKEWLGFIPQYRGGELGSLCVVERGVRTHVNVDPAELFARLLALRPRAFFLAHNHPSGTLAASAQDLDLTENAARMARPFGIQLLGHWIVTPTAETWIAPPKPVLYS